MCLMPLPTPQRQSTWTDFNWIFFSFYCYRHWNCGKRDTIRHRDIQTPPMCSASAAVRGEELTSHRCPRCLHSSWAGPKPARIQPTQLLSSHFHSVCFFSGIQRHYHCCNMLLSSQTVTNFIPYLYQMHLQKFKLHLHLWCHEKVQIWRPSGRGRGSGWRGERAEG